MAWGFSSSSTPTRYQTNDNNSNALFSSAGAFSTASSFVGVHVDAMYLADPSTAPINIIDTASSPFGGPLGHPTWEEALQQNPQIHKFKADEIQFGDIVGSGFFGQVYAGKLVTGQQVALKKIYKQRFRDKNDIQMFCQEIQILSHVSHPSIVSFYGIGLSADSSYTMVLEFMSGGNLRHFIDKYSHAIHDRRRLGLVKSIVSAMSYLHGWQPEPILHRDLSSLNILLDNNGNAKICDFGLSRFKAPPGNSMTTAVGAAAWMAPEVWLGGNYDQKADVYSFGIICWELCTFGDPYGGLVPDFYASKVAMEGFRPTLSNDIQGDWRNLITSCWAQDPNQRPTFSAIFSELCK